MQIVVKEPIRAFRRHFHAVSREKLAHKGSISPTGKVHSGGCALNSELGGKNLLKRTDSSTPRSNKGAVYVKQDEPNHGKRVGLAKLESNYRSTKELAVRGERQETGHRRPKIINRGAVC